MTTLTLCIAEPTPSLNLITRHRVREKITLRGMWQWLVKQALLEARIYAPKAPRHARFTITRYGARQLDYDNLVGGCKPLVDALVREGFALDDSMRRLTVVYNQQTGSKPFRTVIQIESA